MGKGLMGHYPLIVSGTGGKMIICMDWGGGGTFCDSALDCSAQTPRNACRGHVVW